MTAIRQRLLEVAATKRGRHGKALMHVGSVCPECFGPLASFSAAQPALFVGCGYGAVKETVWEMCPDCLWSIERSVTEVNPRRF